MRRRKRRRMRGRMGVRRRETGWATLCFQ